MRKSSLNLKRYKKKPRFELEMKKDWIFDRQIFCKFGKKLVEQFNLNWKTVIDKSWTCCKSWDWGSSLAATSYPISEWFPLLHASNPRNMTSWHFMDHCAKYWRKCKFAFSIIIWFDIQIDAKRMSKSKWMQEWLLK